jgi:fatty acid desaturase (delta-4 desaturase)
MTHLIDDILYDFTNFNHPGGDDIFIFKNQECNMLFYTIHKKQFDHNKYAKYRVQTENQENKKIIINNFNSEIANEFNSLITSKYLYPNWIFYCRTVTIIFLTLLFEYFYLFSGNLYYCILIGYFHALIGLCIQHDANHGALGPSYKWWHSIFKYSTDWIGHNCLLWSKHHWTHHSYTNDKNDPDIKFEPILYISPFNKYYWYQKFQQYYLWLVIQFYGFRVTPDFIRIIKENFTLSCVLLRIFYFFRLLYLPYYLNHKYYLLGLFIIWWVGGSTLSFLFILSHNFEGSKKQNFTDDWHINQILSSATYGNWISGLFTGGLNYQIEHHLFPRVCSIYYPELQPKIIEICKKHNIKYNYFPTIFDNIKSTYKSLIVSTDKSD